MANHEIMIDRGETQSKPVKFINRKIAALTVAGSMLLGGAGCAEARTVDTSNSIPTSVEDTVQPSETKPSVVVTPTETTVKVTPTPTETPTATPTEAPDYTELLTQAPVLEGLTPKVETQIDGSKTVGYYNEKGEKTEYTYNPDGYIEGKKVGLITLPKDELNKLLADELAKEGVKKKIIVPLDITKGKIEVFNSVLTTNDLNVKIVLVKCSQPTTFINTDLDKNIFNTTDETVDLTFKLKDGTIIEMIQPDGLIPASAGEVTRTEKDNRDIWFSFTKNTDENLEKNIINFDESKEYSQGEKTPVIMESYLAIFWDYFGIKETTTDDLLTYKGCIVSYFPQETAVVTEISN